MASDTNTGQEKQAGMDRRDLLKVLSAVPAAALLPAGTAKATEMSMPGMGAHAATATASAAAPGPYQPKTFDAHQYKTIEVLGDIIVPADEPSGSASQAGVPEFIDEFLGFEGGNQLDAIRGGITWLDLESNRAFSHDFIDAAESEKKQLLDRIAYPKTAAPEDAAGVVFFNALRNAVLGAFYSSKMGVQDLPYLGNKALSEWDGCPENVLAKLRQEGAI
ncbi:MAG TPA: gluconate 2-dehydrogenase subunit 3 family protein [Terriglobia bacterium]|nr:gluconate 2-dehydrogenase subunit 3 family protein [Terriglobia bacterium]